MNCMFPFEFNSTSFLLFSYLKIVICIKKIGGLVCDSLEYCELTKFIYEMLEGKYISENERERLLHGLMHTVHI